MLKDCFTFTLYDSAGGTKLTETPAKGTPMVGSGMVSVTTECRHPDQVGRMLSVRDGVRGFKVFRKDPAGLVSESWESREAFVTSVTVSESSYCSPACEFTLDLIYRNLDHKNPARFFSREAYADMRAWYRDFEEDQVTVLAPRKSFLEAEMPECDFARVEPMSPREAFVEDGDECVEFD